MTLVEFLLARFAEDEERAQRAAFGYGAIWTNETDDVEDWSVVHADGKRDMVGCEDRDVTEHIARHDPARVLAECEAKRRIVEEHRPIPCENARHPDGLHCVVCSYDDIPREWHPCPTLRLLALPYADHPDYQQEWAL